MGIHVDSKKVYLKDMTKMEAEQRGRPFKVRRPLIALYFEEIVNMTDSIPNKDCSFVVMLPINPMQYDCKNRRNGYLAASCLEATM